MGFLVKLRVENPSKVAGVELWAPRSDPLVEEVELGGDWLDLATISME